MKGASGSLLEAPSGSASRVPSVTASTLALLFSGTSLGVSVVVGVWQFEKYLLERGRVRVTFEQGWLDEYRLMQGPFRGGEMPED